jgi:hypothetical protein
MNADPEYVEARRVLLDALTALAPHGRAVILVGAQAIYLHIGDADIAAGPHTIDADLAIAPYTTDGDLTLDPTLLGQDPALEEAMTAAGFRLSQVDGNVEPGVWLAQAVVGGREIVVPIDLIVPEGAAPRRGRRGARLDFHGKRAARRALGLEAALVDHDPMTVTALDSDDDRSVEVEVAGPAALFVAKAHKLRDRVDSGRADRLEDKDAADVLRLMQSKPAERVAPTLRELCEHPVAGPPTIAALDYLDELFGRRGRPGIEMAVRALSVALPAQRVEAICVAYTTRLLELAAA